MSIKLQIVTIGSLGTVVTGRTPPSASPHLFGDVHPFITPSDMDGHQRFVATERSLSPEGATHLDRIALPPNSVCIVCIGATIGKACMTRQRSFTNQQINSIVVDESKADPHFVYYLLRSLHAEFRSRAGGAATPILNKSTFAEVEVSVPSLGYQRQAGRTLSAYDDLIENCERRIRVLDEMARALYREIFLSSDANCTYRIAQSLVDDGVIEINDGYRAKNSELGASGLPFARAGNINAGFLFDDADLLADGNVPKAGSKVSRPGDIVFTSKGTVGRFAKVRERTPQFVYSPQLCYWRVHKPNVLSSSFLFRWMQSREFLDQVDQVKGSTDMADYVSLTNQRRMRVRLPAAPLQIRGDTVLRPIDDMIAALTDRRDNLRKTRDILLPRLLSGQLPVEGLP